MCRGSSIALCAGSCASNTAAAAGMDRRAAARGLAGTERALSFLLPQKVNSPEVPGVSANAASPGLRAQASKRSRKHHFPRPIP